MIRRFLFVLIPLLAAPSIALANGRFPESNQVFFSPNEPDLVYMRATFGLLVSRDRGRTFEWICEQAIGYTGTEDPMYAITPGNALIGTTFQGVTITRDNACSWSTVQQGEMTAQVFIDLTQNPNDRKNVIVFSSTYSRQDDAGNVNFANLLFETKDEGQSWQRLGPALDPLLLAHTLDFTTSDPNRLYVTGTRTIGGKVHAYLFVSRTRGLSWDETEIPLAEKERSVFIAAVDPNDAERVYLRTFAPGTDLPTRLLVRERLAGADAGPDAGTPSQIRSVYSAAGSLPGFALTADGAKVYIGGPKDGVRVASTTDFAFRQTNTKLEVGCLALGMDGLWACSNEKSGFVLGYSKDEGTTFESRLHFTEIRGPLSTCPAEAPTTTLCGAAYPQLLQNLGTTPNTGSDDAATPLPEGGRILPGSSSGSSGSSGGCGCSTTPSSPWGAALAVGGAALATVRLLTAVRARRTARSRRSSP